MPNPWFRMYTEFANDPKVQIMCEAMQRRLVMLFCERCMEETFHETERAFHWRISEQELMETKALFIQKGFIDEAWKLLNWNKRQFVSDSSTDRVRRHRQAMKQNETLPNVSDEHRSVTVTTPDTDTDTDTELKKPSRAKKLRGGPTKSELIQSRHAALKEKIKQYWEYKNPGVEMPWGPAEGKNLGMWQEESPLTTLEQFTQFLRNRAMSEVNHAERPSVWIRNVTSYANGPLNEYGKPINGGKVNGKTDRAYDAASRLINEIENSRGTDGGQLLPGSGSN